MSTITPAPQTVGQHIDAALKSVGAEIHTGLTEAQSEGAKVWTWVKTNWIHVAGYASIVGALKKWI
jgi:hypothetical protein